MRSISENWAEFIPPFQADFNSSELTIIFGVVSLVKLICEKEKSQKKKLTELKKRGEKPNQRIYLTTDNAAWSANPNFLVKYKNKIERNA